MLESIAKTVKRIPTKWMKAIYLFLIAVFFVVTVHFLSIEQTPEADIWAILSLAVSMIFTVKFISQTQKP